MRDYSPGARSYELMTIFTPEVADDQVIDQLETVTGYVRTAGGSVYQILHEAPWGRRRFAYPIRHSGRDVRDGFYSVIHFDLTPGQVSELERDLKLDERVLRHMITNYEAPPVKAGEGEEPVEPVAPSERTEIVAGELLRNAAAAREAEEAQRQAAAAQQAAQQAAATQQAAAQQAAQQAAAEERDAQRAAASERAAAMEQETQAASAPTSETAPAVDTAPAESAPADEAAGANAATAEVAEATDTVEDIASDSVPADGTETSEAASTAPVAGATGEEIPASADPVSGEGTSTASDDTPTEDTTDR